MPTLAALCKRDWRPVLVVTQPARRSGRGHRLQQPPVAEWAEDAGLPLLQPETVRSEGFLEALAALEPTTAIVVAFGQIFSRELLALPSRDCINVHASLLPRYRGAAPIQAAILAGDEVTGVTTMLMEEGLDTGPILLQRQVPIESEDTAEDLSRKLSTAGARLLIETLERREGGRLVPRDQDHGEATMARRLRREDGTIDWRVGAEQIYNLMRGLTPWPGVSTSFRGQSIKILWGLPVQEIEATEHVPGTFLGLRAGRMLIACGSGTAFAIERLQRAGRKPLEAASFANGERVEVGERFG